MSRTVHLHVGIAKTGTTYLQRTLFANRALLERNGTLYPGPEAAAHFLASLDLREATFKGYVYERAEGAWGRLVAQADAFAGNTLISHETLAHARPEQIERAVSSFATSDVRVVVTVRDLARQIPAAWQEQLKNRGETPYDEFLARLFAGWRPDTFREGGFWGAQDVRGVVSRWGAAVGIENVSVVTVPPPGADREELWRRFASAVELPDVDYVFAARDNSSLGVAEAELLRRLNPRLADSLEWPRYDGLIKKRLAEGVLGPLDTHGRLRVPVRWWPKVLDITAVMVGFLEGSGATIVGDLHDLEPPPLAAEASEPTVRREPAEPRQPADLSDAELLDVALDVIAVLAARPPQGPSPQVGVVPGFWSRGAPGRAARAVRDRLPARVRHRLRRR